MISRLLPWQSSNADETESRSWLDNALTSKLISLSRRACQHPVHTIVAIALLGSTTYLGLLEGATFGGSRRVLDRYGAPDWRIISQGSHQLWTSKENKWTWSTGQSPNLDAKEVLLATLVFQDHRSPVSLRPQQATVNSLLEGLSAKQQPATKSWAPHSGDAVQAWSILHDERDDFLHTLSEVPASDPYRTDSQQANPLRRQKWVMRISDDPSTLTPRLSWRAWTEGKWEDFLELFKKAETLDIVIMFLGYIAMHLTFVSLFLAMKRMGSNFWLAASTLLSSVFGFLFAMIVTTKLGVAVNMVLLSEGLPFLVVIVGFEKPIQLTKCVLSASLDLRQRDTPKSGGFNKAGVQQAVEAAVASKGYAIVKDYAIEIVILALGAMSGVQGGLRQFCFLAAWILFFDCIMLFTFYTAILTIKLEINRIKRHVAIRKALEEDGVSKRVAESVAQDDEWPKTSNVGTKTSPSISKIFDRRLRDISIPKFKTFMVLGFVIINVLNFCSLPFRKSNEQAQSSVASPNLTGIPSAQDPVVFAGSALANLLKTAKRDQTPLIVTILKPIIYELSPTSTGGSPWSESANPSNYPNLPLDTVSGRMVQSLLRSFEDPVFSKWVVVALVLSVILNGYLFNAARWTIKETQDSSQRERRGSFWRGSEKSDEASNMERQTVQLRPRQNGHVAGTQLQIDTTDRDTVFVEAVDEESDQEQPTSERTVAECETMLKEKRAKELQDEELISLAIRGKIPGYALERTLGDSGRAVRIRRALVSRTPDTSRTTYGLERSLLPHRHFDYDKVLGACCENVVGYLPLPLGVAGPLNIDGQNYFIPMATTEGVLVASTSRGCKAINAGGGAITVLTADGMTRGPCVGFETLTRAGEAKIWLDSEAGQSTMRKAFNSTSRFARLSSMKTAIAGTYVYIRFKTTTGDAMGMNMISKGVEHSLHVMANEAGFDDMAIISVSGNYCTDKKPAAVNWIDGRGKSVVAEAIIPREVVRSILKSDVDALVELNISKNLIGSAMAGSIGGFNAHAANIVTALFLATGQDPAQNVESSNCITTMRNLRGDLQINVSMPSIEVGTIGGGTILPPQKAMLDLLGVSGPHPLNPGDNARRLARIVAAAVLAGELSLCSALAAGHLVKSHMAHNRSAPVTRSSTPVLEKSGGQATPVRLAMTSMKSG